jgi:butyrate kinase
MGNQSTGTDAWQFVLAINPGSTSTKVGIYQRDGSCHLEWNKKYTADEVGQYASVIDQLEMRFEDILSGLNEKGFTQWDQIGCIMGRGGLLKPIPSGIYRVNEPMQNDLRSCMYGNHVSNLGALIANQLGQKWGVPAFIMDPVVVDELDDLARLSGVPEVPRRSIFHALNQKAVARKAAAQLNKPYEGLTLIIAHLGGGISIGIHHNGKVVEVNNALNGDGPLTMERAGTVPAYDWAKFCVEQNLSLKEIGTKLTGKGGVVAHLGTNSAMDLEEAYLAHQKGQTEYKGMDTGKATLLFKTMAYQVAREIGSLAPVTHGNIDAIVLTGGVAYSKPFVEWVKERVGFIAPVIVFAGENELESLALGGIRALKKEQGIMEYDNTKKLQ